MRKGLIITSIICLTISAIAATLLFAQDDIDKVEVRESVTKWRLDTLVCHVTTQQCTVVFKKGYLTNPVDPSSFVGLGEEVRVLFMNIADNPETPEDETLTEFTDLINFINSKSNIKQSLITAVKVKLGI